MTNTTNTELSIQRRISDVIEEYKFKLENAEKTCEDFKKAGEVLSAAACVAGTYGRGHLNTGHVYSEQIKQSLLVSAWLCIYNGLNIERYSSPDDRRRFEQSLAKPPEFTMENIKASFGHFILDPRGNILRGLAEVFCNLDQSYKSHDKVKIGVKGLPKRVILSGFNSYSGYGKDKLETILNALASYQGKSLVTYEELNNLLKDGDFLLNDYEISSKDQKIKMPGRGISLKKFGNGNGHLHFDDVTLRDINKALAEYYGDILPDCSEDKPTERQQSTEVSKDLQYYPTPLKVVKRVLDDIYIKQGDFVLEPSCGCGRFMDEIKKTGADVVGYEVDFSRVQICKEKGHKVVHANFLETVPAEIYDRVIMNPPFYWKHYAKHVEHAFKFLKKGGVLTAILPITARYDHGLLDGGWHDLPVGSFSESGTNINTTVLTMVKR